MSTGKTSYFHVGASRPDSLAPTAAGTVLAETFSRTTNLCANTTALTTSVLYMNLIHLDPGVAYTSSVYLSGTTAMSATVSNGWSALFDSSRNLLRQSTDFTTGGTWGANSNKLFALDSVPVTASSHTGGITTYTVTASLTTGGPGGTASMAAGDSVVISNCSDAEANGTKTVLDVPTSTTFRVTEADPGAFGTGGTVQFAAGKRTYTPTTGGAYYIGLLIKATVPSNMVWAQNAVVTTQAPILCGTADTVTTQAPATATTITPTGNYFWVRMV